MFLLAGGSCRVNVTPVQAPWFVGRHLVFLWVLKVTELSLGPLTVTTGQLRVDDSHHWTTPGRLPRLLCVWLCHAVACLELS